MENQPKPLKTYKNRNGTMKNQSRTIKTNPELYRVVMGGSGGHRKLPGGSDDFRDTQTHKQTLHHNIYIITIIIIAVIISEETPAARGQLAVSGGIPQYCFSAGVNTTQTGPVLHCMVISILHLFGLVVAEQYVEGGGSRQ